MRHLITFSLLLTALPGFASVLNDYAAWATHNKDGSWTRQTEYSVSQSELPGLVPADIRQFCPLYSRLNRVERSKFWVGLLSAMAKPESNFKPQSRYKEKFTDAKGRRVISRGLLQISQESANQPRYGCNIQRAEQLHDPKTNLSCAVLILQKWIKTDGQISQFSSTHEPKGGGRYWSTLRPQRGKVAQISEFTRQLPGCSTTMPTQGVRTAP